jgi:hypothetical protein
MTSDRTIENRDPRGSRSDPEEEVGVAVRAERRTGEARVAVAVVGICGAAHLRRCLRALADQRECAPFRTVVAHDPRLSGMKTLLADFPDVRIVSNEGQRTPLELASRAIQESLNDLTSDQEVFILLTEDHCIPPPDWVARMTAAMVPGRAAVGGMIRALEACSAVDWAFYYVDFFRYCPDRRRHATGRIAPSLTVCNVMYRRTQLEAIAPLWSDSFHETAVNSALRRFGVLWLTSDSEVVMGRSVRFRDAVRERYAFGRLFGCTRPQFAGRHWRWIGGLAAPLLPFLLVTRMAQSAAGNPVTRSRFLEALFPLVLMVIAWSFGEWLGYLTARRPRDLSVAPERDTERPAGQPT